MTVVDAIGAPRRSHASATGVPPRSQPLPNTSRSSAPRLPSSICRDDLKPQKRKRRSIAEERRSPVARMSTRREGPAGDEGARPGPLKIEAAQASVDVEDLAHEI